MGGRSKKKKKGRATGAMAARRTTQAMAARRTKGAMVARASKGSNRRKEEWKDGSGKEKRKQEVKKMDTGDGKELTDGQGREREGIESDNDTGKEDWGHSLEPKRVDNIRQERREKGRQVRLTGFGQDHWEGEMRNWYQDQWWDSRSWRGKSETQGFGRMEKHWRRSREKLQSDGGGTSKGEGGCSGSENENRWGRPRRREGRGLETKMMTWPDWPEEEEIAANKEISEEIQAGTSDEIRRI